MKKIFLLAKITSICAAISFILSLIFLIISLTLRELGYEEIHIDYYIASSISIGIAVVCFLLYVKCVNTKSYNEHYEKHVQDEKIRVNQKKANNNIYSIDLNGLSIESSLIEKLLNFKCEKLENGIIFYKFLDKRKFKKYLEVFYIFDISVKNSFDYEVEKEKIQLHSQNITKFLNNAGINDNFIDCVFIFQEKQLNNEEKNFYYSFIGFWVDELSNKGVFMKNQTYA